MLITWATLIYVKQWNTAGRQVDLQEIIMAWVVLKVIE